MLLATLLVVILGLGGVGLYIALPGGRRRLGGVALLLLAAAAGALVALAVPLLAGAERTQQAWFIALALLGTIGAVRMITHRRPVYSALYFILVILSVTGLLVLMQAEFLAAALVIIYAGAILVTYVFVIMLAQQAEGASYDTQAREPFLGCLAGFVLLGILAGRMSLAGEATPEPLGLEGSALNIGTRLLTHYVIAIELAGVLLLAALVGAIAVARRKAREMIEGEAD